MEAVGINWQYLAIQLTCMCLIPAIIVAGLVTYLVQRNKQRED